MHIAYESEKELVNNIHRNIGDTMCVFRYLDAPPSARKTSDAYRRTGNDEARKYTH